MVVATATWQHHILCGPIRRIEKACTLRILDHMKADSLSKIIKNPKESCEQYVDCLEAAFILIINPDQLTPYTIFTRGLLHNPIASDHSIVSNLVNGPIEKFQDVHLVISCFLK